MERVTTFIKESWNELGKITWPTRGELVESTIVVIVSVILMSLLLGLVDAGLSQLLKLFATSI